MTKDCKCPICEGEVTEKQKEHVLSELKKLSLDHNYKMVTWSEYD